MSGGVAGGGRATVPLCRSANTSPLAILETGMPLSDRGEKPSKRENKTLAGHFSGPVCVGMPQKSGLFRMLRGQDRRISLQL